MVPVVVIFLFQLQAGLEGEPVDTIIVQHLWL